MKLILRPLKDHWNGHDYWKYKEKFISNENNCTRPRRLLRSKVK